MRPNPPLNDTLAHALRFNHADVVANRAGKMTDAQVSRIRRITHTRLRHHAGQLLLRLTLLIGYVIVAYLINPITAPSVVLLIGGCLFGLPSLFQVIDLYDCWRDMRTDLRTRAVRKIRGCIKLALYDVKSGGTLHIGKYHFHRLPKSVINAFTQGEYYYLYYAPKTQIILSAEPLRG